MLRRDKQAAGVAPPLAERMRPTALEEFVGQEKVLGPNTFLRDAIASDQVPSLILWGPPGSGKTTLARIIATATRAEFVPLSATDSGVRDLRDVLARATEGTRLGTRTILFIDEIHRWNKAQQDALLPHVERGTITLIGATTENPSFEVVGALLSRTRVLVLERLTDSALIAILRRALTDRSRGLGTMRLTIADDVLQCIAHTANGDARVALNTLEVCGRQKRVITTPLVQQVLQRSHLIYDKSGEEHYNVISALHKTIRGGDANAAVYWLARMLEGGEDPLYVARRLIRAASEDIGLANPTALILANAAFDACHKIGMPECAVHLAQCVIYLAKSKKDITAYTAYGRAQEDVATHGNLPVPLHLRNASTKLMKDLGYGNGYKHALSESASRTGTRPTEDDTGQQYLPQELLGRRYVE